MWIPKWYWEAQIRQRDELERRVNRLELILLQDAKNKIASLKDEEAGTNKKGMWTGSHHKTRRSRHWISSRQLMRETHLI